MRQIKITQNQMCALAFLATSEIVAKSFDEQREALMKETTITEKNVQLVLQGCESKKLIVQVDGKYQLVESVKYLGDDTLIGKEGYIAQKLKIKVRKKKASKKEIEEIEVESEEVKIDKQLIKDASELETHFKDSNKKLSNGMGRAVDALVKDGKVILLGIHVTGKRGLVSDAEKKAKEYKPALLKGFEYISGKAIHFDGEIMNAASIKKADEMYDDREYTDSEFSGSCYYEVAVK